MDPIVLTITLAANGAIQVSGPIDNPVVCYGMMEAAKDVLRAHQAGKQGPKILVPPPQMVGVLNGRK